MNIIVEPTTALKIYLQCWMTHILYPNIPLIYEQKPAFDTLL